MTSSKAENEFYNMRGLAEKPWSYRGRLSQRKNCPAFSRTCNIHNREKEITEVKYRRNIAFWEARKIVQCYMKDNTYANVKQNASL